MKNGNICWMKMNELFWNSQIRFYNATIQCFAWSLWQSSLSVRKNTQSGYQYWKYSHQNFNRISIERLQLWSRNAFQFANAYYEIFCLSTDNTIWWECVHTQRHCSNAAANSIAKHLPKLILNTFAILESLTWSMHTQTQTFWFRRI